MDLAARPARTANQDLPAQQCANSSLTYSQWTRIRMASCSRCPLPSNSGRTAGRGGWCFSVESRLAGRTFATVRIDVVARGEEIALERLPLPNTLGFDGTPPQDIEAVDRRQHFAETLHAFTRDYGDRPTPESRTWWTWYYSSRAAWSRTHP
ncbi:nucleotidyl transferase AbiEii/AbiGii toxin family protein [Streptomyces sp. NPDC056628]|uniref:nucleotidyl transferase AbiEii/AbiGii toxin family protein n=1 Tax=Streptomyces sp. NPDC056628 TaxID=3345882 RepID=UPI0036CB55D4